VERDGDESRSTTHSARLIYSYEIAGSKYYSNVRRFGQLAGADADWADEITQRYPQGREVNVLYSPDDPNVAVLESGITTEAYWLPGAGLAFLLFGLAVFIWGIPALTRR
jgi:hypothetical protein